MSMGIDGCGSRRYCVGMSLIYFGKAASLERGMRGECGAEPESGQTEGRGAVREGSADAWVWGGGAVGGGE